MLQLKICGNHTRQDFEVLSPYLKQLDYIGLIFTQKSKRRISVDQAERLLTEFPDFRDKAVAVFLNQSLHEIVTVIEKLKLKVVQLHGEESPSFCRELNMLTGCKIWKVLHLPQQQKDNSEKEQSLDVLSNPLTQHVLQQIGEYQPAVDGFLLDTMTAQAKGGSGKSFDWQHIKAIAELCRTYQLPLTIAGGINVNNILRIPYLSHVSGIDIASGAEQDHYQKNSRLIASLIEKVAMLNKHVLTTKLVGNEAKNDGRAADITIP